MQSSRRTFYAYTFCVVAFAAFGFYEMKFETHKNEQKTELASLSLDFETPEECGRERNYLQTDIDKISPLLLRTRSEVSSSQPPRQCVTYIMKNFAPLATPLSFRSQCRDEAGNPLSSPVRKYGETGFQSPCVTEPYVNSVYNSMIDVADCFNIPMKELLPKLYNESGLHINTLGAGFDAGIGQLTSGALKQDVFEQYNGEDRYPSSFEWYVTEMKKSDKPSCKRISSITIAYTFNIPKGQHLCSSEQAVNDPTCFKVWEFANRCQFMSAPENPLRNVLTMAMLYRNNLRAVTGVSYSAGQDVLSGGRNFSEGMPYEGYIGRGDFVERFRRLGARNADQEVLKQIIMGLGFNAGISAPRDFIQEYLQQRENSGRKLTDEDINFQDTDTGKWAIVTNAPTYWRGLGTTPEEQQKALKSLEVLGELGLDVKKAQSDYKVFSVEVQKALVELSSKNQVEADAALLALKTKYDLQRQKLLQSVFPKAGVLTLPEFIRIMHSYKIATDKKTGGAPGYLSFLAGRFKVLEKDMGVGVCTPEKYLKF